MSLYGASTLLQISHGSKTVGNVMEQTCLRCYRRWFATLRGLKMARWKEKYMLSLTLEASLPQNAQKNMAGMRAMAKHSRFSPCDRRGAGHAGRQAHHRPLNQENVLVWKQHSSLSAFMGEFLHTHTHTTLNPVCLFRPDSLLSRTQQLFSLHNLITAVSDGWLVSPYLWLNKRREVFSPPLRRPPRLLYL